MKLFKVSGHKANLFTKGEPPVLKVDTFEVEKETPKLYFLKKTAFGDRQVRKDLTNMFYNVAGFYSNETYYTTKTAAIEAYVAFLEKENERMCNQIDRNDSILAQIQEVRQDQG